MLTETQGRKLRDKTNDLLKGLFLVPPWLHYISEVSKLLLLNSIRSDEYIQKHNDKEATNGSELNVLLVESFWKRCTKLCTVHSGAAKFFERQLIHHATGQDLLSRVRQLSSPKHSKRSAVLRIDSLKVMDLSS